MSIALLIIDMQKAGSDPALGERGQPEAEANAARLLAAWRERGDPVIHIRHDDMNPASPYAPGKPGHAFCPEVAPLPHEEVIEKRTTNAFVGTDLMQALEGHNAAQIVVAGVHLEHCVGTTARMAGNLGFMVYLAGDATASLSNHDKNGRHFSADEIHAMMLAVLDGDFVKVSDTDTLLSLVNAEGAIPDGATLQ
ncbi:cysteine hydrolase family protein [Pseudahrensia aquimaris]|uniref:Cysteine hydrolase family protein n=1 Tax=Pseudahrensia aquimaris TaxID=744461 RepID=A0ABW3FGF5_9HYPH